MPFWICSSVRLSAGTNTKWRNTRLPVWMFPSSSDMGVVLRLVEELRLDRLASGGLDHLLDPVLDREAILDLFRPDHLLVLRPEAMRCVHQGTSPDLVAVHRPVLRDHVPHRA